MSHVVTIQTEVRDPAAVGAACQRLGLPPPTHGTVRLFSSEATGLAVALRDWRYPLICQTESGTLRYDNFEGRWGDPRRLGEFLQAYAAEKVKLEARRRGQSVTEQTLADGSLKLTVTVGGAV